MYLKLAILLGFLCTSTISTSLQAKSSVWKVSKGDAVIYLGGTIHMLRQTDYPLPQEFEQAFQASDSITLEADITAANEKGMPIKIINSMSYQDERTLQSVTSKEIFSQLNQYAKQNNTSLAFYRKAKPGMIMSFFLALELQKIGATQQGVDSYFQKKALSSNKNTLFLETFEQQLNFIGKIAIGNEDAFYRNMLRDFQQTDNLFNKMLNAWRDGDAELLNRVANLPSQTDFPEIFQELLIDRNKNWMPVIESYFASEPVEFVLVGAAHLVGKQGLLDLLQQKGYQISQL